MTRSFHLCGISCAGIVISLFHDEWDQKMPGNISFKTHIDLWYFWSQFRQRVNFVEAEKRSSQLIFCTPVTSTYYTQYQIKTQIIMIKCQLPGTNEKRDHRCIFYGKYS